MKPPIAIFLICSSCLFVDLQAVNRVRVVSSAWKDHPAAGEPEEPETYFLMKGRFFPGPRLKEDKEMEAFDEIAYDLAIQLRKLNYLPASEAGHGDMLILIHYGLVSKSYFVSLLAFDFGSWKRGTPILKWETHYSIRALGQSFEKAVGHLNRIASDYMGSDSPKLTRKRVNDPNHRSFDDISGIERDQLSREDIVKNFLIRDSGSDFGGVVEEFRPPWQIFPPNLMHGDAGPIESWNNPDN